MSLLLLILLFEIWGEKKYQISCIIVQSNKNYFSDKISVFTPSEISQKPNNSTALEIQILQLKFCDLKNFLFYFALCNLNHSFFYF